MKTYVQKLYYVGSARWYDPFRTIWTMIIERKLESDFIKVLNKIINQKTTILELGCGTGINIGRILTTKQPFTSYTGIDFSKEMQAIAKKKYKKEKNITFITGDITTIQIPKEFNLIISTWVLSHIKNPSKTIERFYNKLPKDGTMLLVFFTKPIWPLSWIFLPFTKVFACPFVKQKEINKIPGEKQIRKYACGIATFIIIKKH